MGTPREWILHVDLDQFLAAVEVRRRPELAGRPVVVGGDGDPTRPRQVVATASYEARAHGVRSGMPLRTAQRRCPDAVFLPSDRPAYDAASAEVMSVLRSFDVPVEVLGWDEAFLGVASDDPEAFAEQVKAAVVERTGLTCAVGIGDTKLQAKTATGWAKPGAVARLTRDEWFERLGDAPASDIWGIGPRTAEKLRALGIHTVLDLARTDHAELAATFGPTIGPHLRLLGLGGDDDPVRAEPRVAKGRSHEETFTTDLPDPADVRDRVDRMARGLVDEVAPEGRRVTHVAVKVRTASFWTRTRSGKLPAPTLDPAAVAAHALVVFDRFELDRPVRLLGVRVTFEEPASGSPPTDPGTAAGGEHQDAIRSTMEP
ncbi:DNA polymerase IV [Actinomarinicola tropica]|uniref:DNA polymerase IV n=1 Tax=Actinomarinicola tropica TaxID=2789776 RepID=A0A5Q2RIS2_9ACTN|nr:DNA polymerase IV [Actinomarinicola tropica]QGG94286.1 DNA polymerase IV [Actinomarinicola tropica]